MSNMMIQKKHFLLLEAFLFLIFLVGCTTRKNISGEEHKYEQLSELPGTDAYQAIETICSPEDAALMEEDFYEEAKLWRYAAQKEVFVCRGKEKIEANIVLKLCEYKGYSAIYAVIDYGFENSDVWEQTSKAWLNIKNSQTPEALPEATLGVTVTGKGLPDPILTVCSFYPNIFDLQYQKGISFAEEKFSFKQQISCHSSAVAARNCKTSFSDGTILAQYFIANAS